MNIYILSSEDLSILAVLNTYSAREWNRVWSESGYFTLWVPITEENTEFLVRENLVWPDNQNCVGVIERLHKYTSDDGIPSMEVFGRFVEYSYLSRRIIWETALLTSYPADIIKTIIQDNSVASSNLDRRFGSIVAESIQISSGVPSQQSITYCNSYGNLWEETKKLCIEYGLHMEFQYNRNTLSGVIFSGTDRSSTVNLSTELGFLTDSEYLVDSTDYCNAALIAGEGEGAERVKEFIIPSEVQKNRRELYVDARDLQKTSADSQDPMTDEEYSSALIQRGQNKLLEYPLYESYSCSLQLTGEEGYVFEEDYYLGDTITLTDTVLGITVQAVVKEHQLSEDKDGRTDTITFGVSIPTITSLLKRRG